MCRLFGMTGGRERVGATFWLLEAPDSLASQSRRNPDGTGLGYYEPDGRPVVEKQPLAAYDDLKFAEQAREVSSRTFVAHVRYASGSAVAPANTHPFEQAGRLFAHNGVIEGLDQLDEELGADRALVRGETDSERFFALITREIERAGDVAKGITTAARWVAEHLPVFALNLVLIDADELWALRYPETHELFILERDAGGPSGARHLEHASARGAVRVRSGDLATRPAVVVASEQMDEDAAWRSLNSGELLHVAGDLTATVTRVLDGPPAHLLTMADLDAQAARSQQASAQT